MLKAYELVPEAYWQQFRNARKQTNQTHVEFASVQEQMLERWLSSKNVNQEFKQLRQLVLIEQFKTCINAEIKTHLNERNIDNLHDAATTADDYMPSLISRALLVLVGLSSLIRITRIIQTGPIKVNHLTVRVLKKGILSQIPQAREIEIPLVPR